MPFAKCKVGRLFVVIFLSFFISISSCYAVSPVNLDPDFNSVGYAFHHNAAGGNGVDGAYSVVIQHDGKYVVTGNSNSSLNGPDMAIWRYNPNGTLDTTFNSVGYVTHDSAAGGHGYDQGNAIAIQPDGKYVVTGFSRSISSSNDMTIWRYNSNGTLDTTFNGVGYVTHDSAAGGHNADIGFSIIIQSDGKYVITGSSRSSSNIDMAIWRYNPNGTLDTTFNSIGYVTHNSAAGGNGHDFGQSLQIQSDGKYVVAGSSISLSNGFDMTIWRYNPNGTIDTTFNGVGYVTHNSAAGGNSSDVAYSIALQPDGKYVTGGYSYRNTESWNMTMWRYNLNGTLDTTFSDDGVFSENFSTNGNFNSAIYGYSAIVIQSDSKIAVAGYVKRNAPESDVTLWRLNANGTLDTTLNGTGFVDIPQTGTDLAYGLALDGNGKYALVGISDNKDMGIWVLLDYPHTTSLNSVPALTNSLVITGLVSAPKSSTKIGSVSWSESNDSNGTWSTCTAVDGNFDSLSENFSCNITSVSDGQKIIYIRSCNEFGACTYQQNYASVSTIIDSTAPSKVKITNIGVISNIPDKDTLFYNFTSQTPIISGLAESYSIVHFKFGINDYLTNADGEGKFQIKLPKLPRELVILPYYSVDSVGNQSGIRTLKLLIGEENFTSNSTNEIVEVLVPTESPSAPPSVYPTQSSEPVLASQTKIVITDHKGSILSTCTVIINGKIYTANEKGEIILDSMPETGISVEVKIQNKKYVGKVLGDKVVVQIADQKSKVFAISNYWWIFLLAIVSFVVFFYYKRKQKFVNF